MSPSRYRSSTRSGRFPSRRLPAGDAGLSLIEVLVAAFVLAVGGLGAAGMVFTATSTTADTKAREGATNLAREVVETIVSTPYAELTPATVTATLQEDPSLAPLPGYGQWTVSRRDIPYSVAVTACYVDDPVDGLGAHDQAYCAGSTPGSSDTQPLDYKSFTVTIGWERRDVRRTVTQSTLVAPKGAKEAPAVTSLTSAAGVTVADTSLTAISFSATTASAATGVAWSVDDGVRGLASGSGTSWSFVWNISEVPDGQYVIGARAYNESGVYGQPLSLTITLNRDQTQAPEGFVAGWNRNTATVDSEWLASRDLDTVGYTVYRQQTFPSGGPATRVNCGTRGAPVYITTATTCSDADPILPTSSGAGSIGVRSVASADAAGQSSLTISAPTGVIADDLLVATVASEGTPGISAPPGWTLIRSSTHSSTLRLTSFYRIASPTDPATYTFATADGSNRQLVGGITAYSGVDLTAPVDVSGAADGAGGSAESPNLTTSSSALLVNAVVFTVKKASTVVSDSTLRERWDRDSLPINAAYADGAQASAGPTGIKVADPTSSSNGYISQLFALRPAGLGYNGISVDYWVVAVDRDAAGTYREGVRSNVVDAYVTNQAPYPVGGTLTCTSNADGSTTISWTQPALPGDPDSGDQIAFARIYRDGARFDRTGLATDDSYTDPNPGIRRRYHVTTVDMHLAESTASATVFC